MSDILHDQILDLIAQYHKGEGNPRLVRARRIVGNYNERRKSITIKMKPVLEKLDADFKNGIQHRGCTSMKDYCAKYKRQGMITYARVRQIITGKSGNEGKVKSLDLKNGMTIRVGKHLLRINDSMLEEMLRTTKETKRTANYILSLVVQKVEEPQTTVPEAPTDNPAATVAAPKEPIRRLNHSSKKELSAYQGVTRRIQKLIDDCRAGLLAKDGYLTDEAYRAELAEIYEEAEARPVFQAPVKKAKFVSWWKDVTDRAEAAMSDRRRYEEREKEYDRMNPAVEQLKKTLESVEPITVPGEQEQPCDYTEEEVTQMFAKGVN